jgi:hypothetical protein
VASAQTLAPRPSARNHLVAQQRAAAFSVVVVLLQGQHSVASVRTTIPPLPLHQLSVPVLIPEVAFSVKTRVVLAHQQEAEVCLVAETQAVDSALTTPTPIPQQVPLVPPQVDLVLQQATSPTTVPQARLSQLSVRRMAHPQQQLNSTRPLPSSSPIKTTLWKN